MSFRSRLLLFFMIIVIVPMIAVALVLFSITADSETGKADAAIAQGLTAGPEAAVAMTFLEGRWCGRHSRASR